jgi:hypothetical protein
MTNNLAIATEPGDDHQGLGPPRIEITRTRDTHAEERQVEQQPEDRPDRSAAQVFLHHDAHGFACIGARYVFHGSVGGSGGFGGRRRVCHKRASL